MLSLEQIVIRLQDRNLMEVSRRTGVGYANLHALATMRNRNPTYKVLKALSDYLEEYSCN